MNDASGALRQASIVAAAARLQRHVLDGRRSADVAVRRRPHGNIDCARVVRLAAGRRCLGRRFVLVVSLLGLDAPLSSRRGAASIEQPERHEWAEETRAD
uniref:Uncharacterized protein n=1 Tax=Plectus sambesii TaxID=2011161 RepID=A0A914XMT5_9BILA